MSMEQIKKKGRACEYNEDLANRICDAVASSTMCLKDLITLNPDFPSDDTIYSWLKKFPEFYKKYYEAKCLQSQIIADDILYIADDSQNVDSGYLAYSKLRIDTRKWLAERLAPKIYGNANRVDALEQDNSRYQQELIELRAKLDSINKKDY